MKNKFLSLFFIWVVALSSQAQVVNLIDSLNEQSIYYHGIDLDTAFILGEQALQLSRKNELKDKEFASLFNLCNTCFHRDSFVDAAKYCNEVISFKGINKNSIANAYVWHGLANVNLGYYNEAISSFLKYVEIPEIVNDNQLLADGLSNLGLSYLNDRNIPKAAEYYRSAIRIHENINHPFGLAYIYQNYGRVMSGMSKYDSAKYYFDAALDIATKMENDKIKHWVYFSLVDLPQISQEERMKYWHMALDIAVKLNMGHEIASTNFSIGSSLLQSGNDIESLVYFDNAIKYGKKMGDFELVLKIYNLLASELINVNKVEESKYYIRAYDLLKDSLSIHDNGYLEGILGAQGLLTEEREIEHVKDKLAVSQAVLLQNRTILIGAIAGIVLISIILILYVRSNRIKTKSNLALRVLNEKLDLSMKDKDILTGMIVHDIRSPFNQIESLVQLLQLDDEVNDNQKQIMGTMLTVINDSKVLTNDLLEINRIESGRILVKKESVLIINFVESFLIHLKDQAKRKDIELNVNFDLEREDMATQKSILQRVIENLISNAIKYTPSGGKVDLQIELRAHIFTVTVKDNGPGIPEAEQEILFKKFGRTSVRPSGGESSNGLGLYIVDTLTESLNGKISFISKLGEGSKFTVEIPV
ncbi:MAG: tetratricopeptide repeat-containing sensor histidine kinase [Reichenbachiella sp.]